MLKQIASNQLQNQTIQEVNDEDMLTKWTLTDEEIDFVRDSCRGDDLYTLCFAIQMCSLRNNGIFVNDYTNVGYKILQYLSRQFELNYIDSLDNRIHPKREYRYRKKIKEHLNYKEFNLDSYILLKELISSKLRSKLYAQNSLFKEAEEFLLKEKILLPSKKSLGRKVATIKQSVLSDIYKEISNFFSDKHLRKFDKLLQTTGKGLFSSLMQFKSSPPEATSKVINDYLDKLSILLKLKMHKVSFASIDAELIRSIANIVYTYDSDSLKKISPSSKRHAYIICFLSEGYKSIIDHILDLNNQILATKSRISKNSLENKLQHSWKGSNKSIDILINAVQHLIGYVSPDKITLKQYQETIDMVSLEEATNSCIESQLLEKHGHYKELSSRYNSLREYTKRFYQLNFKAAKGSEDLIKSIKLLRQLNKGNISKIPNDAPVSFVFNNWKDLLQNDQGQIQQKPWEISLYFAVKKALASGDIYVEHSRHYRDFWSTIYSETEWKENRKESYKELRLPNNFQNILKQLKAEHKKYFEQATNSFNDTSFAYIGSNGKLKLRQDDALPIHNEVKRLRQLLESRMPVIRIEDLLYETDQEINFSQHLQSLSGYEEKESPDKNLLYATLLAHGTNIGLYGMFNSTKDMEIEPLRTVSRWYVHKESLQNTNNYIVNQHNKHDLSKVWGDGKFSSSDGQRYRIRSSSILASFYPRYYGYYNKAVSIYTHISDQHSVFSSQVISCSVREATYVLTGLLSHGSDLQIDTHTTDTHGFTELVFALCYLLGFSFCPRIKGIKYQQLYKFDKSIKYGQNKDFFSGYTDFILVAEQWDQIVRVLGSLKNGVAPAHVIVQKLASRSSTDRLTKALITLGRCIKTIYILRYISDETLRYQIHLQLNRGESRHQLAQHIFFANQGIFKTKEYEEIMNKASCLSILSNLILYWNTKILHKIIQDLELEGYVVNRQDLAKVSPLMFKHILMHGTYNFKRAHQ